MSTPTPSATSSAPSSSSSGSGWPDSGGGTIGAATWYGAIALALVVFISVAVASRIMYRRRLRSQILRDRQVQQQRGEGPGLPTYGETAFPPSTLSYLSTLRHGRDRATATDASSALEAGIAPPPPAYGPSPPKYEEAGLESPVINSVRRESASSSRRVPVPTLTQRELDEMPADGSDSNDLGELSRGREYTRGNADDTNPWRSP